MSAFREAAARNPLVRGLAQLAGHVVRRRNHVVFELDLTIPREPTAWAPGERVIEIGPENIERVPAHTEAAGVPAGAGGGPPDQRRLREGHGDQGMRRIHHLMLGASDLASRRSRAEQGDPTAQYELGLAYAAGREVGADPVEAARWLRRAAEHGHAKAQARLGDMYAKGSGVPKDEAEALRWYRRAAEQGEAGAESRPLSSTRPGGWRRSSSRAMKPSGWMGEADR